MQSQTIFGIFRVGALVAGAALAIVPAMGQEENYKSEVSAQAFGTFPTKTISNGVSQDATNSGGVLGSYRYLFDKNNAMEFNYGYTLNTQTYGFPAGPVAIKNHLNEATAAYVGRYPHHWVSPFGLLGAGALVFDAASFVNNPQGAGFQARAAFLYGAGSDFRLSEHFFLRAEYRGLVYSSPNFGIPQLAGHAQLAHRAEPSIGFGARF